jgi:hypothetical protein
VTTTATPAVSVDRLIGQQGCVRVECEKVGGRYQELRFTF